MRLHLRTSLILHSFFLLESCFLSVTSLLLIRQNAFSIAFVEYSSKIRSKKRKPFISGCRPFWLGCCGHKCIATRSSLRIGSTFESRNGLLVVARHSLHDVNIDDVSSRQAKRRNEKAESRNIESVDESDVEEDDEGDIADIDFDSISDEEVLLACRAYLVRKHRLQWTERARRRKQAALATRTPASFKADTAQNNGSDSNDINTLVSTVGDGSTTDTNHVAVGYFWEDPSELIYLGKDKVARTFLRDALLKSSDTDDDKSRSSSLMDDERAGNRGLNLLYDYDEDEEDSAPSNQQDSEDEDDDYDQFFDVSHEESGTYPLSLKPPSSGGESRPSAISLLGEKFTSFPLIPDTPHESKSRALKNRFANPEWKANWHMKRWGQEGRMITSEERKIRRINAKLDHMPSSVLQSEDLLTLTDEELTEAIGIYLKSNKRKAKSHEKRQQLRQRKQGLLRNEFKIKSSEHTDEAQFDNMQLLGEKGSNAENGTKLSGKFRKPPPLTFSLGSQDRSVCKTELELKEKRSKAAKKRYQARKEKRKKRRAAPTASISNATSELTINQKYSDVSAAMTRLQRSLNDPKMDVHSIRHEDIECVLRPVRLAQRRQLLTEILEEKLGCRGKCVPSNRGAVMDNARLQLVFIQHATIRELGDHILNILSGGKS